MRLRRIPTGVLSTVKAGFTLSSNFLNGYEMQIFEIKDIESLDVHQNLGEVYLAASVDAVAATRAK